MEKPLRPSIRVVIVSPRALVRSGLVTLLRGQPQIQVVDDVDAPGNAASCDVVFLDTASGKPQTLPLRVLALLSDADDARAWLAAGAAGVVLETSSVEELLSAIRQVARGETFLPPELGRRLVSALAAHATSHAQEVEPLTDREREVLRLLAQGLSNKDIAQELYLSVRTVEGHLANIYGKLQVKSRTEAALWAVQHG